MTEFPNIAHHDLLSLDSHMMLETWDAGKQYMKMYPKRYWTKESAEANFKSLVAKKEKFGP